MAEFIILSAALLAMFGCAMVVHFLLFGDDDV